MSRGLDASTRTALTAPVTQPYYLVFMDFESPVRLSSRGDITTGGFTWTEASFTVTGGQNPVFSIFNEALLFGAIVLQDGTAGRRFQVWYGDMADSNHPNPELIFDGEMGSAEVGVEVVIQCKREPPKRAPRHFVGKPLCNFIPRPGTRFETPKRVIVLER